MKEGLTAKKLSISVSLLLIIFPANSGAEDTARVPEANSLSNFTREIAPGLTGVTIIEDHAGREETIFLLEGQAKTIDAPDTSKVIVSNPEAVKVATAGKKKLLITAMKAGSSDVTMVLKSGRLIIYSVKVGKEAAFTLDTMNADLKRLFPGSNVSVWAEDETLFIEGRVGSNSDLDGILIYLKGYSNKIVNSTRLADFKQVKLEVKIVEVNRTKLRSFGFNIFGAGNSASVGAFAPGSLKGFTFGAAPIELSVSTPIEKAFQILAKIGDIDAILSIMEGNNVARTLSNPSVIADDGKTANIFVGGSIPVPVPQQGGVVAIQWKDFGVKLEFLPKVIGDGRMALKVLAESGDLSDERGVSILGTTIPAIETRKIETEVTISDNENIMVGGLFYTKHLKNMNKVPLLGDIPVLGVFFRNIQDSDDERELIAVIKPQFIAPTKEDINLPGDIQLKEFTWKDFLLNRL